MWKTINLRYPLPVNSNQTILPSYRHSYRMGIAIQFVRENSQSIEPHCFGDMNIPQLKKETRRSQYDLPWGRSTIHFHDLRDITVLIRLETHGMTPTLNLIKSKAIFRIKHTPTSTMHQCIANK